MSEAKRRPRKAAKRAAKRRKGGRGTGWFREVPDEVLVAVLQRHYEGATLLELAHFLEERGYGFWRTPASAKTAISRFIQRATEGDLSGKYAIRAAAVVKPEVVRKAVEQVNESFHELKILRELADRLMEIVRAYASKLKATVDQDGNVVGLEEAVGTDEFRHFLALVDEVRKIARDHAELRVDLGIETSEKVAEKRAEARALELVKGTVQSQAVLEAIADPERRAHVLEVIQKLGRIAKAIEREGETGGE